MAAVAIGLSHPSVPRLGSFLLIVTPMVTMQLFVRYSDKGADLRMLRIVEINALTTVAPNFDPG